MSVYDTVCMIAAVAIIISLINHRFGRFQTTIAITGWSVLISAIVLTLSHFGILSTNSEQPLVTMLKNIQFDDFLLKGVLGFLLFGGALNINLNHLKDQKFEITFLALIATLLSTFFIGGALWAIFGYVGIPISFIYCCLFGALISPTDPIAVLAIVKKMKAPQRISIQIEGESLFNDGVGLVVFVTIFQIAFSSSTPTVMGTVELFAHEALGGVLFGAVLGGLFHFLIKVTPDSLMRLILTMLVPTAGYVMAEHLGVSGPLAMVVAGIIVGNITRNILSEEESYQLTHLWELADEFLNAILFLLIGLIMVTFSFHRIDLIAVVISIPLVLCARYLSVRVSYVCFNRFRSYNSESVKILTWGGLRGGLALAMAMAIPSGVTTPIAHVELKEIFVLMTYAVVLFSIIVQGSTITPMITKAKHVDQIHTPVAQS